jgi:LmbE family N-acetylglucosaminyl deacetylase
MNPFLEFVQGIEGGVAAARELAVERRGAEPASGPVVMLFSPHPDDECISGLLPLRLMHEAGRRIVNVPVTFGSNVARQAARAQELDDACAYLGWEVKHGRHDLQPLDSNEIARLLEASRPGIIFMPHDRDWNSRHVATHHLVVNALKSLGSGFSCTVAETEYWAAMDDPNLMVEGDAEAVAELVAATSLHVGEVARNPYHLLLPAWMQDNVRRGGELVGGQGGEAPDFAFATLYRLRRWQDGRWVQALDRGRLLPLGEDLEDLL